MITRELVLRWFLKVDRWNGQLSMPMHNSVVNSMSDGEVDITVLMELKTCQYTIGQGDPQEYYVCAWRVYQLNNNINYDGTGIIRGRTREELADRVAEDMNIAGIYQYFYEITNTMSQEENIQEKQQAKKESDIQNTASTSLDFLEIE